MKASRDLTPEETLTQILVPGGGFRAWHAFVTGGDKRRYFFIANAAPANDQKLVVYTSTTQIAKQRSRYGWRADDVLVHLDPGSYSEVAEACVIDCETPMEHLKTRAQLEALAGRERFAPLKPLPAAVRAKLCGAVAKCVTLTPWQKRLVLGAD
jgi:hypothetical protein